MKVAVLLWAACMLLGAGRPPASATTTRPVVFEIAIDGGIDPAVARSVDRGFGDASLDGGPRSIPRSASSTRRSKSILDTIAAPLLARHGAGYDAAVALLCTTGDNPDRLATEASFAALCGTAPVPISSGNTQRRRLNRAGDRNANSTLWTIVMVRLRSRHAPTVAYLKRRFVAREVYLDI